MRLYLLVWIVSVHLHGITPQAVNVALNKPVEARVTCGYRGEELFYSHNDVYVSPFDRIEYKCENETSYPAQQMVDGNLDTWWQSASRQVIISTDWSDGDPEAVIDIDLQQVFDIESLSIQIGESRRPESMVVLKSQDGVIFSPWVIKVSESYQCVTLYQTRFLKNPETIDSTTCDLYLEPIMLDKDELVMFDFDDVSEAIIGWRSARFLKIRFYKMDLTLGPNANGFHHFAVDEVVVMAECTCSGLHIGCEKSEESGQYECVCGGNTRGEHCQECQPFYNQRPFTQGEPCQACNCFQHADTCYYDLVVDESGRSLNADGEYSGGGVCENCRNNTKGTNCEKCVLGFYRPIDREQTAEDACMACNCSSAGAVAHPLTAVLGDCVMNTDAELPPGVTMAPGDCFCKDNVQGAKCDQCKPSFFNLQSTNELGCENCLCNVAGSVGGSTVCTPDGEGQCQCKEFVINRQCDECADQYYGLSSENINGCLPCDCNTGGSVDNICNKTDGQCNCQPNVGGRQCTDPASGNFFPDLHFISSEAESAISTVDVGYKEVEGFSGSGYVNVPQNEEVRLNIQFPVDTTLSGEVQFVVRYAAEAPTTLTFAVTPLAGPSSVTLTLPACPVAWCYVSTTDTYTLETENRIYTLELTPAADITLDTVVALPTEFISTEAVLGDSAAEFESTCDVIQDDMKIGTASEGLCLVSVFTLTSHYLDGTMPCGCNVLGSYANETCAKYGGQCVCKPGVGGRQCDVCQPEYFDLTVQGCQACNCMAADKVCDTGTGQCDCPPNVRGEQCEQCFINYWNWHETEGCQPCDCDLIGSSSLQCNLTTGVCPCKPGVGGEKCDACLDGFTGLSILTGCQSCNCDMDGSLSFICDPANGQCPCKGNTQGQFCDTCKASTFYNDADRIEGCLDCICMGISTQCTSTTNPLSIMSVSLVNISDSNSPAISLSTATERLTTLFPSISTINGSQVLVVELGIQSSVYWRPNGGISGNLLPMYGNLLSFTVHWTSLDTSGDEETELYLILVGRDSKVYRLPFPAVPIDTTTNVAIKITEVGAVNASGGAVSRGEMIKALSAVEDILVPATLYSRSHTVTLFNLSFGIAAEGGTDGLSPAVEQCVCGIQYQGQSCEECAYGYQRAEVETHSYLGVCVQCECNNHAEDCDADTGVCTNCLHNTAGDHCELCAPGYYGDATLGLISDCVACPCYSPRVVNSTCTVVDEKPVCSFCAEGYTGDECDTCENFYYGNPEIAFVGTCDICECHGNSETCDTVTGECVDCANNSTGFNCESCKDEWFGNASAQNCQACECDLSGTDSVICNHTTGQCECHPGVGERTCSQCLPNYYGYNNETIFGCADCECNPGGSADLQCDEIGVCSCNEVSGGVKCDFCAEGYYGLPYKPCELCSCDLTGTIDASQSCERVFGQCDCKPGVDGRKCDQCQRLYKDFSDTGCTQCEVCQYSLGNDTLLMKENWEKYWNDTVEVEAVQAQDTELQRLATEINITSSELGLSEDRLNVLTTSVADLQAEEPVYIRTVNEFVAQVSTLEQNSIDQGIMASEEEVRVTDLMEVTSTASRNVLEHNTTTHRYLNILNGYVTSAAELLEVSLTSSPTEVNVTFDSELENTRTELGLVEVTALRAQNMATSVQEQGNDVEVLINATKAAQDRVDSLLPKLAQVEANIDSIRGVLAEAWQTVNSTIANRNYTVHILGDTQDSVTYLSGLLAENQALYEEGSMLFNESKLVIEGLSTGAPPPINTTLDLQGIDSFNQGADYLENVLIPPLNLSLFNLSTIDLPRIRVKVQELLSDAQAITEIFNSVSPIANQAADAISDYEAVITVLDEAKALALEANVTMMQVLSALDDVSEEDLQNSAQNLALSGSRLQTEASQYDGVATTLSTQLDSLETNLDGVVDRWSQLSTRIESLTAAAEELDTIAKSSTYSDDIAAANTLTVGVLEYETTIDPLVAKVDSMEQGLADVKQQVDNASLAEEKIASQLLSFQTRLDNSIQRNVDLTSQDYTQSISIRNRIDSSIAAIEDKIQQALSILAEMEQPVSFNQEDYAELTNPLAEESPFYNDVTFTFKYDLEAVGVLFVSENYVTGERMVIQLVEERVVYEFSNTDTSMRAVSPADLCVGCWFRVIATRYGIDGQLTVTSVQTGGTAVTHVRGESSLHNRLSLTSPVYIGGLPPGYDLDGVDGNVGFSGCIYSATFNGHVIPVWQKILHHTSTATCCSPPPSLPTPTTISATSFDNFGSYLRVSLPSLPIATSSHIAIELRTFSPEAVVFLADMNGFEGYYGIFVQEGGRLGLAASGAGESVSLLTEQMYNDGSWHRVTVQMNLTHALLHMETNNGSDWVTAEVMSDSHSVDLSALTAPQYTIGGQNPDTSGSSGPVTMSFAGCIQSFQHNTGADLSLTEVTLNDVELRSSGVSLDTCYMDVVSGIGLTEPQGYVALNQIPNPLTYLEFDLITFEPHGILIFAELSADPPVTFLYIALYHGDILVLFNQGSGIQPALTTRGLYMANGQSHTITLDTRFPNSLRLEVAGQRHYGALTMSPGMNLRSSRLYVGGVPPWITLDAADLPVTHGLVGGIRNIKVNTRLIDYFGSMDSTLHLAAYLSGIPAPADSPPPLPYPTEPPAPSTVAPTCAPNNVFSMSQLGMRFGDEPVSYLALSVETIKTMFQGSFVVRVKFRALQPNGILFYIASSSMNAESYFTIYLDEGFLVLSVQTNTTDSQEGDTKLIKSKKSHYGNGRFWEVVALRLNDFLALTVPAEEYTNNGNLAATDVPSSLQLSSTLFIGGVSSQHAGFPFNSNEDITIGSASFHGCIQAVTISSHEIEERSIDLSAPVDAAGISQCYDQVNPGVFLNATNAYVRVMSGGSSTFDIEPGFNLTIKFRSARLNGTLLLAYLDESRFFLVDMLEGQICILVGNTMMQAAPLIAKSHVLDVGYGLCNGDLHTLSIVLEDESLLFNFDSVGWERIRYPQNFNKPALTGIGLFTGGIKDSEWSFPVPTSRESFHGCIQDLNIKGRTFNLVTSTDKKAVVVGCPSE